MDSEQRDKLIMYIVFMMICVGCIFFNCYMWWTHERIIEQVHAQGYEDIV